MSKHDFDNLALAAVADQAIEMQDAFLANFVGTPRSLHINEMPPAPAELLKLTYRLLLQQVRDAIEVELEIIR